MQGRILQAWTAVQKLACPVLPHVDVGPVVNQLADPVDVPLLDRPVQGRRTASENESCEDGAKVSFHVLVPFLGKSYLFFPIHKVGV